MRKRLLGIITREEQDLKNFEFNLLYYEEPIIKFNNVDFVGSFYEIEENSYLFVGIDKQLLSVQGFINFIEQEYDIETDEENNHYILYRDGVLIIEVNNFNIFSDIIDKEKIKNYQENITISDVDEMNEISFSKYFQYLLEKLNFTNIIKESFDSNLDFRFDLTSRLNNEQYYFEFKISQNRKGLLNFRESIMRLSRLENKKIILVTNQDITNIDFDTEVLKIIDRKSLEIILRDNKKLFDYL